TKPAPKFPPLPAAAEVRVRRMLRNHLPSFCQGDRSSPPKGLLAQFSIQAERAGPAPGETRKSAKSDAIEGHCRNQSLLHWPHRDELSRRVRRKTPLIAQRAPPCR